MDRSLTLAADFPSPTPQDWLDAVDKVLRGKDFDRTLVTTTADGIEIGPLYTSQDCDTTGDPAGMPGATRFERGSTAAPRPHGRWDVRSVVEHPDLAAANAMVLAELQSGATSIELHLDLGRSGRGVSLRSTQELAAVLDGVLFDLAPISLRAGAHAAIAGQWLLDLTESASVTAGGGELGIDPLGTLALTGRLPQGLDRLWDDAGALAARCVATQPSIRATTVSSEAVSAAGASDAEEIAWLLAAGTETLRALVGRSLDPTVAAGQIAFDLTADVDVFGTVAKLRAFRWAWATVLDESGVDTAQPQPIRVTARSAWRHLSSVDPWVNLLRGTAAAFGSVIGGADTVIVAPFDQPDSRPGQLGSRMARNTQLLLQDESGLGRVTDPAGGSWFVESLTDRLAEAAWEKFAAIEAHGGATAALLDGTIATTLRATAAARSERVADRRHRLTGVSEFPLLNEQRPEPPTAVPPDDREPVPLDGEAGPAESTEIPPLATARLAMPFEQLRAVAAAAPQRPTVWLAAIGPVADHTARTSFAANFFAAGGVATETDDGHDTAADLAAAFARSGATVACICGTDNDYERLAGHTALALTEAGATRIYLAGRPGEYESAWRDAGIDQFIAVGSDLVATLTDLHHHLGLS